MKHKQVWSTNELPFLIVKLSGKHKAMKQDFFIRIPMEGQCDLNAQFLCIILREKVFFQKMTHLPPFSALYELSSKSSQINTFNHSFMPVTKYNSRKINKPKQKGHICLNKLTTFSWIPKPQKGRTNLFQKRRCILLNDKVTKKKNFWLKKLVPLY